MADESVASHADHSAVALQQLEARKSLLKVMLSKFSSTPIATTSSLSPPSLQGIIDDGDACLSLEPVVTTSTDEVELRQQLDETETSAMVLTPQERDYLSTLLDNGDVQSMRTASQVLQDESVFPSLPQDEEEEHSTTPTVEKIVPSPRSSKLQQHLFRIHTSEPLGYEQQQRRQFVQKNSILSVESTDSIMQDATTQSRPVSPTERIPSPQQQQVSSTVEQPTPAPTEESGNNPPKEEVRANVRETCKDELEDIDCSCRAYEQQQHHPFEDIASWLDGSLGIEVRGDGSVVPPPSTRTTAASATPFCILGTSADDVSCHPHVLSPPLMESLLQFVPPEPVHGGSLHVWLKYSLVRDGPGMFPFLRQTRASTLSFLAIETDMGHVLGAFTSQPWRLSMGWYGGSDSFLWKLRRSRVENEAHCQSVAEQIRAESEVQVYPYRAGHKAVQYCSKQCLMLGNAEIIPSPVLHDPEKDRPKNLLGTHYGHGLYLDKDLLSGSTSTSETFGNPCLIDSSQRGQQFRVSNVELWTLTPHDTVAAAEQSELSSLFLERSDPARLNVYTILVGGPI